MVRRLGWVLVVMVSVSTFMSCQSEDTKQMPLRPARETQLSDIDVPIGFKYDKARSWLHVDDRIRLAHLSYKGSPRVVQVEQFFLDQMPVRNWKLSHQAENYGHTTLVFSKGGEVCTIDLYRSWGETRITVTLNKRPD